MTDNNENNDYGNEPTNAAYAENAQTDPTLDSSNAHVTPEPNIEPAVAAGSESAVNGNTSTAAAPSSSYSIPPMPSSSYSLGTDGNTGNGGNAGHTTPQPQSGADGNVPVAPQYNTSNQVSANAESQAEHPADYGYSLDQAYDQNQGAQPQSSQGTQQQYAQSYGQSYGQAYGQHGAQGTYAQPNQYASSNGGAYVPPQGYSDPAYAQQPYGQQYGQPGYEGCPAPDAAGKRPVPQGYVQRNKILAGLLGIIFGSLGIHNFYLGNTTKAVIQVILTCLVVTSVISVVWGLVEGILILCSNYGGTWHHDAYGIELKD